MRLVGSCSISLLFPSSPRLPDYSGTSPPLRNQAQGETTMQPSPTREEALAVYDAARREHQDFLASIPREKMTEPGANGPWSVKDVIAHVMAYRNSFTASLEAIAAGKPKPPT